MIIIFVISPQSTLPVQFSMELSQNLPNLLSSSLFCSTQYVQESKGKKTHETQQIKRTAWSISYIKARMVRTYLPGRNYEFSLFFCIVPLKWVFKVKTMVSTISQNFVNKLLLFKPLKGGLHHFTHKCPYHLGSTLKRL